MKKLLVIGFAAFLLIVGANAQNADYDPVKAPFGHGQDSISCRENLSLMQTAAKAEAYESALGPWSEAYKNCPASSKNLYIYGHVFSNRFMLQQPMRPKKEYIDKVMEIYDTGKIFC